MKEKALIIGGGAREHSLAEYISRSPKVGEIFCAPGNGGTERIATNLDLDIKDANGIASFCVVNAIDLAVIGPEDSIEASVGDALRKSKINVFGANRGAGRMEWDKIYANDFMNRKDIPHPKGWAVDEFDYGLGLIHSHGPRNIVIKPNGLAQGKGVSLPNNFDEAQAALHEIMVDKQYGQAGEKVLVQERLHGKELSVTAICHGNEYVVLPMSQDYKRRNDGDEGPNTGGMGSIAPVNLLTSVEFGKVRHEIIEPTLRGMVDEGMPLEGVLYVGLMLTSEGPKVLEYNIRFGDPELQVILPLIDEDIYMFLKEAAKGNITQPRIKDLASALVVLASENYPEGQANGEEIRGLGEGLWGGEIFHAGTQLDGGICRAVGGRILNVVGLGKNIPKALELAYSPIDGQAVGFDNMHYRTDIGSNL